MSSKIFLLNIENKNLLWYYCDIKSKEEVRYIMIKAETVAALERERERERERELLFS